MSGHNKWSQIKRKKGTEDAKRSKLFSLLAKAITVEARAANGNISSPSVRAAIEKARKANMPNENIERAVKRGSGADGATLESVLLEAYGPGGVALLIEATSDNRNRTVHEVKHLLSLHGSDLAAQGAAQWAFEKKGGVWQATVFADPSEADLESLASLVEALEEHDDITRVVVNLDENDKE